MRDRDLRNALLAQLSAEHAGDTSTRIVEEMSVWSGTVRIDLAVINGELCGYELKSDRDTLDRLPLQAEVYSRVFDRVVLVVGQRHLKQARTIIPKWWGVTTASFRAGAVSLRVDRIPKYNTQRDPQLIADLITKDEALAILDEFDLAKGWRGKRAREVHQRLTSELTIETLSDRVRQTLKDRNNWLGQRVSSDFDMSIDADCNPTR